MSLVSIPQIPDLGFLFRSEILMCLEEGTWFLWCSRVLKFPILSQMSKTCIHLSELKVLRLLSDLMSLLPIYLFFFLWFLCSRSHAIICEVLRRLGFYSSLSDNKDSESSWSHPSKESLVNKWGDNQVIESIKTLWLLTSTRKRQHRRTVLNIHFLPGSSLSAWDAAVIKAMPGPGPPWVYLKEGRRH